MEAHSILVDFLTQQHFCFRDMCQVKWLSYGNRNISFFRSLLRPPKAQKPLASLRVGHSLVSNLHILSSYVIDFYAKLFNG